jgi:hypothetical protein
MDFSTHSRAIRRSIDNPKSLALAAAAYAEGLEDEYGNKALPPPELTLAWQVERWGADAVLGAVIPVRLLRRMNATTNIYGAFMSFELGKKRVVEWANRHPKEYEIVHEIRTLRIQHG